MVAKTLTLDCPRGETGRDCLTNEGPTRLPEAFRALQAGKLPRKAGLIVVRHGQQYELTLQAETLAVSGANLPKIEGASGREIQVGPGRRACAIWSRPSTSCTMPTAGAGPAPSGSATSGRIRRWLQAA